MLATGIRDPNPVTKLSHVDGRIKLFLTVAGLLAATSTRSWLLPFCFGILSILLLNLVGVSGHLLWRRLRPILFLAIFVGATQIFINGHTPWFEWNIFSFHLIGYHEGLMRGSLFAARIFGGISVMSVLTFTTTVQEWIQALAWFRVPQLVIEIMTLAYSSLFTLLDELERLQKAQHMRLGYGTWWRTIQSIGAIGGILFIRVFDKSVRLWQAMRCRGYNGEISVHHDLVLRKQDLLVSGLGLIIILGSWVIGR
ncbi:cobalt ECF transporter T component CbiQ [Desulfosporosinus sp. Sb-LF]|uniref:cobalt ECF transporter T component CbiQ n=1 Tax=Desulfosporosinus sp. Sb-LF TaxID=2560027 RepID=UPI00130544C3|nr:cobalt ECF transporter T component CbiQ [Desulfosporosinus sp. Sb-LF]